MKPIKNVKHLPVVLGSYNTNGIKKEFNESDKELIRMYGVRRKPIPIRGGH